MLRIAAGTTRSSSRWRASRCGGLWNSGSGRGRPRRIPGSRRIAAAFQLVSASPPAGDQPKATAQLLDGLGRGKPMQVLLGATGTGEALTDSKVAAALDKP